MWTSIIIIHVAATWFMVGLVWFVHFVHYPLLRDLPVEAVPTYQRAHVRRTVPLIPIVMIVEAISAVALLLRPGTLLLAAINLGVLASIWFATFVLIVPTHRELCEVHDSAAVEKLIRHNRVRSFLWLLHGIFSMLFLVLL